MRGGPGPSSFWPVLEEVEREGVDAIVIGGDIAAGPPQPREVVELIRSLPNTQVIRGNADRLFADEYTGDDGLDWLLDRLEDDQANWLAGLPFSVVLDDTLYVHAAPDDDRTIVTELMAWGRAQGAARAYLQVREENEVARALYRSLGFSDAYRYTHRVRPLAAAPAKRPR